MKRSIWCIIIVSFLGLVGCSLPANITQGIQDGKTVSNKAYEPEKDESKGLSKTKTSEIKKVNSTDSKNASTSSKKEDKIALTVFYQDKEGVLIPVTREIQKQQSVAKTAIYSIIDNTVIREDAEGLGFYPVLPLGTEVLGINIKDGVAIVDFNSKLLSYSSRKAEVNIISSIVYTLTEFNTINGVKILVNGREIKKMKYDSDISGLLNRDNTLVNSSKANLDKGYAKLNIYLCKMHDNSKLLMVPVSVQYSNTEKVLLPQKIVEFLAKKSNIAGLFSEIPQKTELINHNIKESTLVLNFNEQITKYGGTAKEDAIVKQIMYSMKQVKGIKKVKILINNKAVALPEGTEGYIEMPLPASINPIEE